MPTERHELGGYREDLLRRQILRAYRVNLWNTTHTAAWLEVSRRTLLRWVQQLKMTTEIVQARRDAA